MDIRLDDLRGPEIRALLEEHLANMRRISPPGSVHALDLDGLRRPGVTFWTAWEGGALLGCGALKQLDARHGEIKSMRTAESVRRRGVARAMLEHLVAEARRRGYARLSLETGSQPFFEPARRLYAGAGFAPCGPFDGYTNDPNSVFMTMELSPRETSPPRLLLQAALNGNREHAAVPRTPGELAADARRAFEAGARVVHLHPHDGHGRETLEAEPCAAALRAVRAACPGLPVSLSTSAEIEPDPARRRGLVAAWTVLPDLVTANMDEPGIVELCGLLRERGIGIEAGLLSMEGVRVFVESGVAASCVRVLVEPLDPEPAVALAHAEAMERALAGAGIRLEQVHHGEGIALWAVVRRAAERGHGIRTGLEDTVVLPDGRPATGNAELVEAAASLLAELRGPA